MTKEEAVSESPIPFLTFEGGDDEIPVYFEEDWHTGIGGGLWSTGLAFSKYLTTSHALKNMQELASKTKDGLSVLELGSGNGLLSICLLALAHDFYNTATSSIIKDLTITDLADHLPLVQKTLDANPHIMSSKKVFVLEHDWGQFLSSMTGNAENEKQVLSFEECFQQGKHKFDLIFGSDVAYHEDLYDILITSLLQYSHYHTVILLGVTMNDTKPEFFRKLRGAGFEYQKFSDHLLDPDFRGRTFGIFLIQKRQCTI